MKSKHLIDLDKYVSTKEIFSLNGAPGKLPWHFLWSTLFTLISDRKPCPGRFKVEREHNLKWKV